MLAVSFFALVFSSLVWLIYSVRYVLESLKGVAFFDAGAVSIISYIVIVCLPIFLIWLVFSFVSQYLHNKSTNAGLAKLMSQMKRSQEYSDLLSRIMIEAEQQIKDGFMLSKFDLLLADMNELLAEIIRCCNIASGEQIERLWNKVQNGGKWSFGKVIVEVNSAQPKFQRRVYEKASKDVVLAGTIMEFCARYQSTVSMLEKHDREKVFLNIIEAGVMGKVFSVFAPIADEIRRIRETSSILRESNDAFRPGISPDENTFVEKKRSEIRVQRPIPAPAEPREKKESLIDKLSLFKKKEEPEAERSLQKGRDPFSIALEKSFGNAEEEETPAPEIGGFDDYDYEADEPRFDIGMPEADDEEPMAPTIETDAAPEAPLIEIKRESDLEAENEPMFSDTQKRLNDLKKEWGNLGGASKRIPAKEQPEEDTLPDTAYPFGGWVNEENYK